jgi:hypothetical protein
MKRSLLIIFTLFILSIFVTNKGRADNPAYNLMAVNFAYSDSLGDGVDAMTFDIVIEHVNLATSGPFEFALGQYYFNIDAASGVTSADYNYYIVPGSTQFSNPSAIPRNPTIVNPDATTPQGASLRVNSNTVLGVGNGPIVATFPGTRIVTMRLKKKNGNLPSPFMLNMTWRIALPTPFTKIFAYIGTTNTDISNSVPGVNQATIDTSGIYYYSLVKLLTPANNSTNNPTIIDLVWNKRQNAVRYQLQIATDSLFTGMFYNDAYITDTSITLGGFNYATKYYWKVTSFDSNNSGSNSSVWNFKIQDLPALKLKLTSIVEGMYYPLFNQLSRRDTVTVELRQNVSPYNIVASKKGVIDSLNYSALFEYPFTPVGTYYIVFKHLNSISTWSKSGGVAFNYTDTVKYNFTTSSSQAYGNNLRLKGGKYCILSGDVNQSGFVDATDMSIVDNASFISQTGRFIPADLNCDNIVDAGDLTIVDNNGDGTVGVIKP